MVCMERSQSKSNSLSYYFQYFIFFWNKIKNKMTLFSINLSFSNHKKQGHVAACYPWKKEKKQFFIAAKIQTWPCKLRYFPIFFFHILSCYKTHKGREKPHHLKNIFSFLSNHTKPSLSILHPLTSTIIIFSFFFYYNIHDTHYLSLFSEEKKIFFSFFISTTILHHENNLT